MRRQIGGRLEEAVVEVEGDMLGLQVVHDEERRDGAWELSERVEDGLSLESNAGLELVAAPLRTSSDQGALVQGSRRVGVVGAARAELALRERFDGGAHIGMGGGAESLEDAVAPSRVGGRPALVLVEAEAQS